MVTENVAFKDNSFKTAHCVKIWDPSFSPYCHLVAIWHPSHLRASNYKVLASSTSEEELKIWWDTQGESIPFSDEKLDLVQEDIY